ncbi:exonuclease domain-containing protein [Curtobacterium sp. MCLR17_036]|uniref:exonuclease domain-containing protein n=1 Tax=Curtobacterium sp. MCLR17_036 TaxID=2175620 RepID=UPI000DA7C338|nr:exonuclease domain-containing protein [Curtobacterium sp. MCLR17_036]WIE63446.1 exonuclease domain-containing protein [Curtobacterium sp. MCLR17_036]
MTFSTAPTDTPAPPQDLAGRPWWHALGVFDLETTGVDVETARIVTAHVGLIDMTGASIVEGAWVADPGVPVPEGAAAVHGYTTERAQAEGRPAAEVVAEVIAAIEAVFARGIPLVIYNAPYDLTVLDREAKRHGFASPVIGNVVDPLVIDKALDTYRKGKRTLEAASETYGVTLDDAHDAGADAVAAGRVAQAIAGRYPEELGITAEELHRKQVGWCADQAASFQQYMRAKRDPSFTADGRWPHRGAAAGM